MALKVKAVERLLKFSKNVLDYSYLAFTMMLIIS